MFVFKFIVIFVLFFLLSPGVLVSIPRKGNKFLVALCHALIFALIVGLFYALFCATYRKMKHSKRNMREGGPTEIGEQEQGYGNCPSDQHWISGKIKKYGYCSPSTVSDILIESSITPSSAKTSATPSSKTCPPGTNWISGSNPKYGYCSTSKVTDILHDDNTLKSASYSEVKSERDTTKPVSVLEQPSPTQGNCPENQYWVSGTNQKYGYCSPSKVTDILNQPSKSTLLGMNPVELTPSGATMFL